MYPKTWWNSFKRRYTRTVSGKTVFAKPNMVTTDGKEALEDVDVPVTNCEARFKTIAPYLKDG